MNLCMRLLEKELNAAVLLRKDENAYFNKFCLQNWKIMDLQPAQNVNEQSVFSRELLLVSADMLSDHVFLEHEAVLCAGMPPDFSSASSFSACTLLAVDMNFSELINSVNRIFLKYRSLKEELIHAARLSRDIGKITETAVPALFDNLTISTMDFHILAEVQSDVFRKRLDPITRQYFSDKQYRTEFIQYMNNDRNFSNAYSRKEPFFYQVPLFPMQMLCMNVFYQGSTVCRLVHYLSPNMYGYEAELLQYLAHFVQFVYEATGGNIRNLPQNQLQYVLMKLAGGEKVPKELLLHALSYHNWNFDASYACLCILPGSHNEYGVAYFCKLLNDEISNSCSFVADSYIACVVNLTSYQNDLSIFMEKNVEFFRDNIFRAGLSNAFTDPYDLAGCWIQAKIALQTGMSTQPSFWYHRFSDQASAYIKKQALLELPARYLAAPELISLQKYDQKNHTEYYETLRIYLRNNMNILQTARDLYIARGTMNFRLSRLKKITGLNLQNPDIRLYLEFSFKLLE